jgi:CheY-like chemotaxis protein
MSAHRVLVVEDDHEIRDAMIGLLEDHGLDVRGVANGEQALQHLATADRLPCLILLDLMMPVMDGHAFREAQLQDHRFAHIPIIVISAYRDVSAEAEMLRAVGYLRKPPKAEDLFSAVEQHC